MVINFLEVIAIFVCFCVISAIIDLLKEYAKSKLIKFTVKQSVDTALGTAFRSILKYKLAKNTVVSPVFKERGEDDAKVSDLQ